MNQTNQTNQTKQKLIKLYCLDTIHFLKLLFTHQIVLFAFNNPYTVRWLPLVIEGSHVARSLCHGVLLPAPVVITKFHDRWPTAIMELSNR